MMIQPPAVSPGLSALLTEAAAREPKEGATARLAWLLERLGAQSGAVLVADADGLRILAQVGGDVQAQLGAALAEGQTALERALHAAGLFGHDLGPCGAGNGLLVLDQPVPALANPEIPPERVLAMIMAPVLLPGAAATALQDGRGYGANPQIKAILDALPVLVVEVTAEGRYTDFIFGREDLLLRPPSELVGRSLAEVLPPDLHSHVKRCLEQVIAKGRCPPMRYPLDLPIGRRWFQLSGSRRDATDPAAPPTALFVITDITDSIDQVEELARMGTIVEAMTNMVVVTDREQRIVWANRAWQEALGWQLDEVKGRDLGSLVRPPDHDPASAAAVTQAIAAGGSYRGQTVNIDRHGNRKWIDFNILPLQGPDGRYTGHVSIETDVTVLKESQQAAAEAAAAAELMRSRLHNAIETLPDGVVIWDAEDRLVDVNSAYKRMYAEVAEALVPGVSQEAILRLGVERRAFPSAWGREEEWIAEQWQRYRDATVDEVERADGRCIRRLDLRTVDGGRVAVRIDTTERQRQMREIAEANAALSEARAQIDRVLETAQIGTWNLDVDTGKLEVGGCYLTMLGEDPATVGPITGEWFRDRVHPDDRRRNLAPTAAHYALRPDGSEPINMVEFRLRHRDGSWVWIESRSGVIARDPEGRVRRIGGIHSNITERKLLEAAIRAGQDFLAEVMNASTAAIVVVDSEGAITYANPEAERVLGLTVGAMAGRSHDDPDWGGHTIDGRPLRSEETPVAIALRTGQPVRDMRYVLHWTDGRRQILSVNAVPHRANGDDGRLMVIASFSDITADLERAEQLEHALADAREASRLKSAFLANMSHEIRTPLNGVLGMAELLEEQMIDPRKKAMVHTIRESGELLLKLINDILDMSKIEAGKLELEAVPFVPAEAVRSLEDLYRLRAEENGLGFEVFLGTGADRPRLGDPLRLQQIVGNVLANAIKFTERGFVTLLVSGRPDQSLVIEVRDTGIGMTEKQQARLFRAFEQAEAGTTRRFGGTGLGMAIVQSLVEMMGGTIEVRSTPGSGTDIRISLPLPAASASAPTTSDTVETAPSLHGVHVLAADDNATNRQLIREMLADTGAALTMAENGAEAVDLWTREAADGRTPDVLLLDISMPVMDGIEALSRIRNAGFGGDTVPAVALTAHAMPHQVAEFMVAGFDAHVAKPFRRADIVRALGMLLSSGPADAVQSRKDG